jgi:hypothetical protein
MFRSHGADFRDEKGDDMPAAKAKTYREQTFDHLNVDWSVVERRLREEAAVRPAAA